VLFFVLILSMKVVLWWEHSGNGEGQCLETDQDFGHITAHSFTNGDNRASFLEGAQPHILYLWHKANSDSGVLGNMLQVLAIAVAVDCDTVGHTDCSEVMHKRKAGDKTEEEIKEQTQFCKSVGGALTRFATNESMAAYASGSEALGWAEVEMDNLEDLIEEAEFNGNDKKVAWLKKCLARWCDVLVSLKRCYLKLLRLLAKKMLLLL
jgi:hypothetical protein